MSENEERKVEKFSDIELLEKEFRKTTIYGKVMIAISILFCAVLVIGLGIAIFEAIVNFKNLDMNIYQPIIDLGELCRHCGGDVLFYAAMFYLGILPMLMKYNKETDKIELKKNNIVTFWLVIYGIIFFGYSLNFIVEVVPIIERIIAM